MFSNDSNYAKILKTKKILYIPTCIIIEMMTRLYSRVSSLSVPTRDPHADVPEILILLRRLNVNLRCTSRAYEESRIRFFIGDWRDDKLRARRLFFNLMSRLGDMSESLSTVEKKLLYDTIEEMGREWEHLDRIMDRKCEESKCAKDCGTCRYFRSFNKTNWRNISANVLLHLNDKVEPEDSDAYLILVCYKRIRTQLINEITEIEKRTTQVGDRFPREKILCVSEEDIPISCPTCSAMTDGMRLGSFTRIVRESKTKPIGTRISLKRVQEKQSEAIQNGMRFKPTSRGGLVSVTHGRR